MPFTQTLAFPIPSPAALRFDIETLQELGFDGLSPEVMRDLVDFLRRKLQLAVGERLAENIATTETSDLEAVFDCDGSSDVLIDLDRVCPDHLEVVCEELERLVGTLEAERPAFLAVFGASDEAARCF